MKIIDDQKLLERAQTSAVGFGELFDAYYDRIYAYAYRRVGARETAEDIATSVFENALSGIKKVRWQGKPIIAWLYRIAARRVADHYRGKRATESLDDFAESIGADAGDGLERDDEYDQVRRGIERLAEREREIIRLVYFDELDGAQLAATLGCTTNNAYVRLHRALKKLKIILEIDNQSDPVSFRGAERRETLAPHASAGVFNRVEIPRSARNDKLHRHEKEERGVK